MFRLQIEERNTIGTAASSCLDWLLEFTFRCSEEKRKDSIKKMKKSTKKTLLIGWNTGTYFLSVVVLTGEGGCPDCVGKTGTKIGTGTFPTLL